MKEELEALFSKRDETLSKIQSLLADFNKQTGCDLTGEFGVDYEQWPVGNNVTIIRTPFMKGKVVIPQ